MNTEQIKQLLHHREPYLMVSEVLSLNSNSIHTKKIHTGNEAHLKGHFPGAPVGPGAMLQELCTQSAGILITRHHSPVDDYNSNTTKGYALGVLNKVNFSKFLEIVKPDHPIEAKIKLEEKEGPLFKFSAKVLQQNKLKAKLSFNLVNASDEILS